MVVLVTVAAFGRAALIRSAHRQRVAVPAQGNAMSFERAAVAEVIVRLRVGGLEKSRLLQLGGSNRSERKSHTHPHNTKSSRASSHFVLRCGLIQTCRGTFTLFG